MESEKGIARARMGHPSRNSKSSLDRGSTKWQVQYHLHCMIFPVQACKPVTASINSRRNFFMSRTPVSNASRREATSPLISSIVLTHSVRFLFLTADLDMTGGDTVGASTVVSELEARLGRRGGPKFLGHDNWKSAHSRHFDTPTY